MPFIEERRASESLTNLQAPDAPDVFDPTLGQTFGAAFRTQNVVGSFAASRGMPDPYEIEDGFDGIQYFIDNGMEAYVEEGAGLFNKRAADAKIIQINREIADNRTLQAAGSIGVIASIAAGVVDIPTLLIPGSVVSAGARATGSMALGVAAGAALDAGVSEAALQATQATRTAEESVLNVGGSIVIGGALGALVGRYLKPADAVGLSKKVEAQAGAFDEFDQAFANTGASSAGAAARDVGPLTLKDEAIIRRLPIISRQDPLIRSQLSPFDTTRQTVRGLAETPLEYAENAAGVATERGGSVETRVKMWNAPMARGVREIDTLYARYYHGTPEPSAWQRRLSPALSEFDRRVKGGQKMTYAEFKEEVGRATYMGDTHEIAEVAQAAKVYRAIDEQLKKAAIEARLFPEDVDVVDDISHRFRVYNREMIIARRNDFTERLFDYFRTARDAATKTDVSEAADDAARRAAAQAEEFSRLSDAELRSVVDEVTDTILGNAEGRIPYDIVAGPRGALKERVLKIESAKIHEFLENDIEQVLQMQMRTMAPDIEIAKKFGSVDMKEQIRQINDEANRKIAKAKTDAERKSLDKSRKEAVRDIEGIRDRIRHTYAMPSNPAGLVVRANRVARNLNYVRLLGGMTLSAIPDMAKVVYTHGLISTFRDGFLPMISSFRKMRLAADEVKLAGTALDMVLDTRTMAIADIMDDFGRHSKFERGLSTLSSKFGVISLMAPWNAAMKQFAGIVTMTNMLRSAERFAKGAASKGEIRKLGAAGIDLDLAQRIAKQFSEHGERGDVWLAQTGAWTDRGAIEAVRSAVVRDVDRIIVTPGQDKPLWMSTELGKTVGQFKSFAVSSMQKTMLSGIQQRDAATLNGTLMMLGLGALTYAVKEKNAGRDLSDDPAVWAVNAFDRSGLTGWLMEANNISEKATRGRVGLSAISGEQVTRYASRNVTGAFLGPSADAVADIFQVSGSIFAGDTTRSDLRKARQLLPMQNLFYTRQLLNAVEEGTGQALNLPDTRRNK